MRKTIFALLLSGSLVPAVASAQLDGGAPTDGSYVAPRSMDDGEPGGHTGSSLDPNGNMGNEGRTGKPAQSSDADGGADGPANGGPPSGTEGNSGSQDGGETRPYSGKSNPPP